jgi:hypothetical protein
MQRKVTAPRGRTFKDQVTLILRGAQSSRVIPRRHSSPSATCGIAVVVATQLPVTGKLGGDTV